MKKSKRLTVELRIVKARDYRERQSRFYLIPIFTDFDGALNLPDTENAILVAESRRELVANLRALIGGAGKAIEQPTLKF